MSLSNYLEGKILDHIFSEASYTAPTWYVALFTSDPGETGASGEVSGDSYARVALGETTRTDHQVTNDAAVSFPQATGSWGTVTHFGLFDAASEGNFLWGGELITPKAVSSGDTAQFDIGEITFSLD